MEKKQKGRSGVAFFLSAVALVFTAILATVLLANEQRNLKQVLTAMGFQDVLREAAPTPAPEAARPRPKETEPLRALLPVRTFADLRTPEQQFIRQIRSDPRALCERLREAGFRELAWKSAESGRWECSSLVSFVRPGAATSSSIFIFVKGSDEDEITSFRVKLNIEHSEDTQAVTSAAATAASVFLKQVHWADSESVTLKIQALSEFDLKRFGSRIQFKRESGDTPRYNFLANQAAPRRAKSAAELYFDREKWLAPWDGSIVSTIRGPETWNRTPAPRQPRTETLPDGGDPTDSTTVR
ncbi:MULTISPECIES: DUF6030 family protein [Sinorhizobium]|uniref:PssV n=2 Tax=Sinorhizobium TaxID=28105 RepID=A0A2S3YIX4_9HYPH|nr:MULTISPECIES: DUF6030 family protein [Sinorhizobium]AUX78062.1 hypothetical protein NXT3_CH03535 [Sinorhizobium fredii]PDT41115.1 hypothetical protein CO656_13940 [Sinorhizobium sp. FG01]PDT51791.1 hypothetical protein CO664_18250 [Sinorhizobium sp. NG07B]POH26942.1 hypothetical protein ATY31_23705 [Sinorhizobium americanum]POH27113.1 hypothetical protein ATY30_22760 [Sinorhizobium americanum]